MSIAIPTMTAESRATIRFQRVENGLIAIAILAAVYYADLTWWVLIAAFLVFDLSALGYVRDNRVGAFFYNLIHNYSAPAILAGVYAVLRGGGTDADWLALLAASWGFHVAIDRVLGYGLKMESFQVTHLGRIGRPKE